MRAGGGEPLQQALSGVLGLGVEAEDLGGEGVEVERVEPRGGQAGVVAELVDELLHRLHLGDDGADRADQDVLVGPSSLASSLCCRRSALSWMGVSGF